MLTDRSGEGNMLRAVVKRGKQQQVACCTKVEIRALRFVERRKAVIYHLDDGNATLHRTLFYLPFTRTDEG